ncbi:hypothetical protein IQ07DRAFT_583342 [Pyrenochaeta sp. DS3sAY3a]|nr:hypothetical protein IQ07DRAFT_583342 [Pyrenochaeta sp. DS3sAY3a]
MEHHRTVSSKALSGYKVQRLVTEVAKARIINQEGYRLPPIILKGDPSMEWLELTKDEISIVQPCHISNCDAKLQLRGKLTGEEVEMRMEHRAVILVFGNSLLRVVPSGTYFHFVNLNIKPEADHS